MAKSAWALVWNLKTPLWATLGVAIIFSVRVAFCSYEVAVPGGLDFEWYGEHCGPGHGDPDKEAIDELDEACKRHDAAYEAQELKKGTSLFTKEPVRWYAYRDPFSSPSPLS